MPNVFEQIQLACVEGKIEPTPESISNIVRSLYPATPHTELVEIVDETLAAIFGLGPLEDLLLMPNITDILVAKFDEVWIDRGSGLEKTDVSFASELAAQELAKRIATRGHRRLDDAAPFVDIQTQSGLRFHAMLPPIAVGGVSISVRIPSRNSISLEDMLSVGSLNEEAYLAIIDIIDSQKSFIISGGTGSGKTTLLSAMLTRVHLTQRIVVIEDSTELSVPHPHVVSLQSRLTNSEGAGAVTMTDLVRQALRMRPDRIVVGEVRGKEISDLLLALNTGHKGSATTIHADYAASVPTRIEALGLLAGLPREAIHAQLYSAFDLVIQMKSARDGERGILQIAKLEKKSDGTVETSVVQEFATVNQSLNQIPCIESFNPKSMQLT